MGWHPRCLWGAVREDGFSLLEALIAAGVLVAGITAVLQLWLVAAHANVEARDATYATVLAAQKMEELRAAPFPDPGGTTEYLDARGDRLSAGPDGAAFERRWTVEPLLADPDAARVVIVRVWRRGAAHRAVQLAMVRMRRGE
jgi:Tfp pilus assembly protein PilV